jgi:hypothetical protein
VHLDQPVLVRHGTVDDKEDEVVIVVELRPLTKVLGVLEGERMESEDVTQYGEAFILCAGRSIQKKLPLASRRWRLS